MKQQLLKALEAYEDEEMCKSTTSNETSIKCDVDLIDDEFKLTIELGNASTKYKLKYKKTVKEYDEKSILKETNALLLQWKTKRDETLDQYEMPTPTPTTAKAGKEFPDFDVEELMVEEVNLMNKHSNETCAFFGQMAVIVVKDLDNVRLHVYPDDLPQELQTLYGAKKGQFVSLSIQFAPDYINNPKVPDVQYKPDPGADKNGFGEHMSNIAHNYIRKRWKEMHGSRVEDFASTSKASSSQEGTLKKTTIQTDDKLRHIFLEEKMKSAKKIEIVRKLLKEKKNLLAASHSLFYTRMNVEEAKSIFIEAGGNLSDSNTGAGSGDGEEPINIILELLVYLYLRTMNCTASCLMCDEYIIAQNEETKNTPTICTKFKCMFAYVELGVCSQVPMTICPVSICGDIMEDDDIVDLLISMAYSAATSGRRDLIFDPFPAHFTKSNTKNFDAVAKLLENAPTVAEMKKRATVGDESLKQLLGGDLYSLVAWILNCKRPALLKMPEKKRVPQMQTEYQYMMLVDTPEKTAAFKAYRKQYGSYFAFHGSGVENWHSILRQGIVIASNTKLMTTGAAYGPGIYMAADSGTSLGYARGGTSWPKSKFGNTGGNLKCMAICEVAKHPNANHTCNPYYVVNYPGIVVPRFFMFWKNNEAFNVRAADLDLAKYIST